MSSIIAITVSLLRWGHMHYTDDPIDVVHVWADTYCGNPYSPPVGVITTVSLALY